MQTINKKIMEIMTGVKYTPQEVELTFNKKLGDSREVVKYMTNLFRRNDNSLHLVTAPTGSGKTYLVSQIFDNEKLYWENLYKKIRKTVENTNLDNDLERIDIELEFKEIGKEIIALWDTIVTQKDTSYNIYKKEREDQINHFKLMVETKVLRPVILNITCPAYLQNRQNASSYNFMPLVKGESLDLTKKVQKISAVYEKNMEIVGVNARIITVVDEAHLITDSSTFRREGINALREITKASQVTVMITATPLALSIVKFDSIAYVTSKNYKMDVDTFVMYKGDTTAITNYLVENYNNHNALFRINSFNEIEKYTSKYSNIARITKEEKSFKNKDFSSIVNNSTLLEGCKLCTSLMDAGINLNEYPSDLTLGYIALDKKHFNLDSIEQFANRPRKHLNKFIIVHNPAENEGHPTLEKIFKELYKDGLKYFNGFKMILEGLKMITEDKEEIKKRMTENLSYVTVDGVKNNHFGSIYLNDELELKFDRNIIFKVAMDKFYQMLNQEELVKEFKNRLGVDLVIKEMTDLEKTKKEKKDNTNVDLVRTNIDKINSEDVIAIANGKEARQLVDVNKVLVEDDNEVDKYRTLLQLEEQTTLLQKIKLMLDTNIEYNIIIEMVKDTNVKLSDMENYVIEEMYIRYNNCPSIASGKTGLMYKLIVNNIGNVKNRPVIKEEKFNVLYEIVTNNGFKLTKSKLLKHIEMIYNVSASQEKIAVPNAKRWIRINSFKKKH